jgi:energy-coupling factor transport system ATP-binding protein
MPAATTTDGSGIAFEGVSFAYAAGDSGRRALRDVTLTVTPGELLAVVGANGSGKSTLARLCNGLLVATSGSVRVDGIDPADPDRTWDVRSRVAMVFQDPDNQIVGTVVEDDVAFGPENLGVAPGEIRRRVDAALAAVGLAGFERREPHMLSEGQKQRLAVASALAMEPSYLVMDEPCAMLDPEGRADVLALADVLAHERAHGVLLVTHDIADVALADRVAVLDRGELTFLGTPEGLLGDEATITSAGLEMPPIGVLSASLRDMGFAVPVRALTPEAIVGALWP